MQVRKLWTAQLEHSIGGMMKPVSDPFDGSVFYVSDGIGTTYGAMRFRKLSLETGEELSSILIRNCIRCLFITDDFLYAFSNRKIWKLYRKDFSVAHVYAERVPRYADHACRADENTFLLLNHEADYLQVFDLQTFRCKRKDVGGGCGLFPAGPDSFLIFPYEGILQYSFVRNSLQMLVETERYSECAQGASGLSYLLCQAPATRPDKNGREVPYSNRILICAPLAEQEGRTCGEVVPGKVFNHFRVSQDERTLYLYQDRWSLTLGCETNPTLWVYSIPEQKIVLERVFEECICEIFDREGRILTYSENIDKGQHLLNCWEIEA